jgi:proteic killer suppression protein
MINRVEFTKNVIKQLRTVPKYVVIKLKSWVELVEIAGLAVARKIPGYHDEPLQGSRIGQRSIRLTRSYRAFYKIQRMDSNDIVLVLEVNKHDY